MTEQETIYQEVCGLLIKLFEIDPQTLRPKPVFTKTWSWTALTRWT